MLTPILNLEDLLNTPKTILGIVKDLNANIILFSDETFCILQDGELLDYSDTGTKAIIQKLCDHKLIPKEKQDEFLTNIEAKRQTEAKEERRQLYLQLREEFENRTTSGGRE